MDTKPDTSTGPGVGKTTESAVANMAESSRPAQARSASVSISPVLDILSLLQDDLSQYQKHAQVTILARDGKLAIVLFPVIGHELGYDTESGNILVDGEKVTQ